MTPSLPWIGTRSSGVAGRDIRPFREVTPKRASKIGPAPSSPRKIGCAHPGKARYPDFNVSQVSAKNRTTSARSIRGNCYRADVEIPWGYQPRSRIEGPKP
jgi:hypothetical protein